MSLNDPETADGIIIKSQTIETDDGPIEKTWEVPVWVNRPDKSSSSNNNNTPAHQEGPLAHDDPYQLAEDRDEFPIDDYDSQQPEVPDSH